ncbi:MAG: hypothetical protein QXH17_07370 [Candidatus Bathyarchaeia archaeon]
MTEYPSENKFKGYTTKEYKEMNKRLIFTYALIVIIGAGSLGKTLLAETKYIEKKEIMQVMKEWNKSLGVNCQFCHTGKFSDTYEMLAGKQANEKDLRALVNKNTARTMLGLMIYLNRKENKNYTCESCHQGKTNIEVK